MEIRRQEQVELSVSSLLYAMLVNDFISRKNQSNNAASVQ